MKIRSDAHFYLSDGTTPTGTVVTFTGATAANPMVLTAAAVPPEVVVGGFLSLAGVTPADAKLEGASLRVTAVTGTEVTVDYDNTGGAALTAAEGTYYSKGHDASFDLIEACMANVTITGQAPDSIDMDDMCGTATVLGAPKPPAFTFSGFVDAESEGFANLVRASLESPKLPRTLLIDFGPDGGYIVGPVEIGELTVTAGVGTGLQFSGAGVFKEVPFYSWTV